MECQMHARDRALSPLQVTTILTNPNLALYDLDYVTKQLKSILAMFPRSYSLVL